jgi:hypothetical protein
MKLCSVDGCGKKYKAYGLCNTHYKQKKYITGELASEKRCTKTGCDRTCYGNGLCRKHYDAKRRRENPEKTKKQRITYLSNPENRAKAKAYRVRTAAAKQAYDKIYTKTNRDKVKASTAVKNARRRCVIGTHSKEELAALFVQQKGCCAACKNSLQKDYHRDHILPIVAGGSNWISNIQLLCKTCNLEKAAKHPVDFMREKGYLL